MRTAVFLVALASLASTPLLAACSHDHDEETPAPGLADVVYEEGASDEALANLLAKPVDGGKKVTVTAPAAGATLPKSPVTTFTWEEPKAVALQPAGRRPFRLAELALKSAYAHGTPHNGPGYLLAFTKGGASVARVFTTQRYYLPSADVWAKLSAAGSVSLTVTAGTFEDNALVAGSGPFASAPVAFTVAP